MYFKFFYSVLKGELVNIVKGKEKRCGFKIPRQIAKEEHKSVFGTWLKMMTSMLSTGCTFQEYYNLNFIHRTRKNQKTFITSGSNWEAYRLLNDPSLYHLYINKDEFNTKYADFIGREWIQLSRDKEQIYAFFRHYDDIILKPRNGDSGKGIQIIHQSKQLSDAEIDHLLAQYQSGIAEELVFNHPKLNELNPSSLNTMRIVTLRDGDRMDILFAGIRFGAKGKEIDNISTGGRVAPLDIASGKICGSSYTKKTVTDGSGDHDDHIGFQMPRWEELNDFLYRLTAVVPPMRYMAWDIAITDRGFAAIEGNHSSGNTVIQAHLGPQEQGLKVKLNAFIAQMKK